jgi:hypothetical protein
MADYYPLISKAVAGLEKNTGEGRRALYERARKALVDQLRGVQPPLSETDITRERLALEESIRKVETEAVRMTRAQVPPAAPPVAPPRAAPPEPPRAAPPPPRVEEKREPLVPPPGDARRERKWLDKREEEERPESREGIKGFSDVVAEAETLGAATAHAGRTARETYSSVPSPSPEFDRIEPRIDVDHEPEFHDERAEPRIAEPRIRQRSVPDRNGGADRAPPVERQRPAERRPGAVRADLGPVIADDEEESRYRPSPRHVESQFVPDNVRQAAERGQRDFEDEDEETRKPMFGWFAKSLIALGVIVILLVAIGGGLYWQRGKIGPMISGLFSKSSTTTTAPSNNGTQAPRSTKIPDRVGQQDQNNAGPQEAIVTQRVVLYEEDPSDTAGKRSIGTVAWRAETVSPSAGQPPDRAVRADISIPDRGMQVVWSLRRNNDKDLPASHTISIQFTLPPNFSHGGISEIRGVLMKQAEQTRGVSLAGIAVKVTNNFFLVGLSSTEADVQRNIQLLKERQWFDIAIVYTDGRRAILAVEKGNPGDRAFTDAFAAWGQ